jgi:hypothetical protein
MWTVAWGGMAHLELLNLFSAVGRVVSKRFLMKRPCLNQWQLVIHYLMSAMAFGLREQFRVLYLDKRNNLIADKVLHEGTVDHTPVYPREVLRRGIELHATARLLVHNHPSNKLFQFAKRARPNRTAHSLIPRSQTGKERLKTLSVSVRGVSRRHAGRACAPIFVQTNSLNQIDCRDRPI